MDKIEATVALGDELNGIYVTLEKIDAVQWILGGIYEAVEPDIKEIEYSYQKNLIFSSILNDYISDSKRQVMALLEPCKEDIA